MDKFVVRTSRESWLQSSAKAAPSRGKQMRLGDLARTVRLPPGVTARVYSDDYVLSLRAVLENSASNEMDVTLALQQLSCLIMTEACLRNTKV